MGTHTAERTTLQHTHTHTHGGQTVVGETAEGVHFTMGFGVADVSRPLLSITGIVQTKHRRVVYDEPVNYIDVMQTGRRVRWRIQNNL